MLDYETFCQIRDHLIRQQLSVAQTARALALDVRTVAKWANVEQFHTRSGVARVGKLDAFKGQIVRWLDAHLRKIVALADLHGKEAVARALDDGLELHAFSAEYIAHILSARRRIGEEPAALQLTRRADLLELELPEPDLSIYDRDDGDDDDQTP